MTVTTQTLSARSTTDLYVEDLSGHCNLKGKLFTIEEVDEYEEISITGDQRAVPQR